MQESCHLKHVHVRLYSKYLHLAHRGLGVVEAFVNGGTRPVDILAIEWRREGAIQHVDVSGLELVAFVLKPAHFLRLGCIPRFHEGDKLVHCMHNQIALIVQQAIEIRHTRKHCIQES